LEQRDELREGTAGSKLDDRVVKSSSAGDKSFKFSLMDVASGVTRLGFMFSVSSMKASSKSIGSISRFLPETLGCKKLMFANG
jgi:hypothetical protein